MKRSKILLIDAAINLLLGFLLLAFPPRVIALLGVPMAQSTFYPSILGGLLVGIGIALPIEYFRGRNGMVGLGLGGAIAINICGGFVLAANLVGGKLDLPARGQAFLWGLVVVLVGVSGIELLVSRRQKDPSTTV